MNFETKDEQPISNEIGRLNSWHHSDVICLTVDLFHSTLSIINLSTKFIIIHFTHLLLTAFHGSYTIQRVQLCIYSYKNKLNNHCRQ